MIKIIPLLEGVPIMGNGGALGWSSVTYVESEDLKVIVDTGFHGNRHLVLQALKKNGIETSEINILFLTHLHFDHCQNFDLFPNARIILNKVEYEYAKNKKHLGWGDTFIPEYIIEHLDRKDLQLFKKEHVINENLKIIDTPGHTPGSSTLLMTDHSGMKTAICGDLFKYAWEVYPISRAPLGTFCDIEVLKESQQKILNEDVTRFIPGHDRPFQFKNNKVIYESPSEVHLSLYLNQQKSNETHFRIALPE